MLITTKNGNLLLKGSLIAMNCECCDDNPCGSACGPGIPSPQSLDVTISNWAGLGGAEFRDYPINGTYTVPRITTSPDCFVYQLFQRTPATCTANQNTWAFAAIAYDLVVLGNASAFNVYMKNIIAGGLYCFQWRSSLAIAGNALCQTPVEISGVARTIEQSDGGIPFGTFDWRITSNPLP